MARLAVFVPSFEGGGAERVMVTLANLFAERQHEVQVITAKKQEGAFASMISQRVQVVPLRTGSMWRTIGPLARYLKQEQPDALLSTLAEANMVALVARRYASVAMRVVILEANTPTFAFRKSPKLKKRIAGRLIPHIYPLADAIVAVSTGVRYDLEQLLPSVRNKINLIFNPVIGPDLHALAQEPLSHPWFHPHEPPVVLSVGRLESQKDYAMLL